MELEIKVDELDFIDVYIECLENEKIELEKLEEIKIYCDKSFLLDYFNRMKYDNTKNTSFISTIGIMNDLDKLRLNSFVRRYIDICEQLKKYLNVQRLFKTKQKVKGMNLWEN